MFLYFPIDDLYTSWSVNVQSFSLWNQISFFWSSVSCSRDLWVELSSHSPALGAFGYPSPDAAVYHALATRSAGLRGKTTPKWTVFVVFFLLVFSISILGWWVHALNFWIWLFRFSCTVLQGDGFSNLEDVIVRACGCLFRLKPCQLYPVTFCMSKQNHGSSYPVIRTWFRKSWSC